MAITPEKIGRLVESGIRNCDMPALKELLDDGDYKPNSAHIVLAGKVLIDASGLANSLFVYWGATDMFRYVAEKAVGCEGFDEAFETCSRELERENQWTLKFKNDFDNSWRYNATMHVASVFGKEENLHAPTIPEPAVAGPAAVVPPGAH